jgi:hypothetical protein
MKNLLIKELIFVVVIILFGILSRTIWHIGPNIEFVTALSLLAGFLVQTKLLRFFVPLLIIISSDLFIGNTNIIWFTWSAFFIIPFIGGILKRVLSKLNIQESEIFKNIIGFEVAGIVGVTIFFLWTNFGVVALSDLYPNTLQGLFQSYYHGLPFLVNQLLSNIVFIPFVFLLGTKLYDLILNLQIGFKDSQNINKSTF